MGNKTSKEDNMQAYGCAAQSSHAKQVGADERIKACNTANKPLKLLYTPEQSIASYIQKTWQKIMRITLAAQMNQEPAESLETMTASAMSTPHLHFSKII